MKTNFSAILSIMLFVMLSIVFAVLKIIGVIAWSWWWVFAPVWIPSVFVLIAVVCVALTIVVSDLKTHRKYNKIKRNISRYDK